MTDAVERDVVERLRELAYCHTAPGDVGRNTYGEAANEITRLRELLALAAAPSEKDAELSDVLTFLTANRETHRKWAEWFEAYPDKEAEYVATGEWDGAVEQRRLETGYTRAIELLDRLATLTGPGEPIDMMLFCPNCGVQHVDEPDERTPDWTNPPHRSHLCHDCGCIWRPADVPTNGVAAIETRGKADTWTAERGNAEAAMQSSSPPPKEPE